jgi:hypothetical protein
VREHLASITKGEKKKKEGRKDCRVLKREMVND